MSISKTLSLLCVSFGVAAQAWAETPFVTQLRLPARNTAIDVFAWREGNDVTVSRADLERLSIAPRSSAARIRLANVPGLSYRLDESAAAIEITCTADCFDVQRIGARLGDAPAAQTGQGGYINYDVEARWLDASGLATSGVAEAVAFGDRGLLESSWLSHDRRLARLETRWTLDRPQDHLRVRIGDAAANTAAGAPLRFAGLQIGRHFGLQPSLITYPTPTLSGEAVSTSTVELYVDGALRARDQVAAGPFAFDEAPLVGGAGEALLVITDLTGRQQIISRPFFVSTALLRPGLADWTLSLGAAREQYGRESWDYGERFVSGRYRLGLTRALTLEAAADLAERHATVQVGGAIADTAFGQVHAAFAANDDGDASELAWLQQRGRWTFGAQAERRDAAFRALGRDGDGVSSWTASVNLDLEALGSASLFAAEVERSGDPRARTWALHYGPRLSIGSLALRVSYIEADESEFRGGISFSRPLGGDVDASLGYQSERRGATYRAALRHNANWASGLGWHARGSFGAYERLELGATQRGEYGDTNVDLARTRGAYGARLHHIGSFGVVDGVRFAARPIHGSFALVETGAANVGVLRDRLRIGATDQSGRAIATGLRPYDANTIAIAPDDLPFDRAPATTAIVVAPAEGAGVVVRFDQAAQRLRETQVLFSDGSAPPRGTMLVRRRDGARFPVGAQGRVVLIGAAVGDVLHWADDERCTAVADEPAAARGLVIACATP